MSDVRRTADEAMVGGLIEDAETDRRLVAEWDATLPPLPDGDYDDPHVVEERKREALLAFLADPEATALEKRNVLDAFQREADRRSAQVAANATLDLVKESAALPFRKAADALLDAVEEAIGERALPITVQNRLKAAFNEVVDQADKTCRCPAPPYRLTVGCPVHYSDPGADAEGETA